MTAKEKILVHVCCASCSSYVLPHLQERYEVAAYFYNPNIQPAQEYQLRLKDMRTVCNRYDIQLIEGVYDPDVWWEVIEPYRHLGERSERCWECYGVRLEQTAARAAALGIGIFTSTLSVSPHKAYECIIRLGEASSARYGVRFLVEDFKKARGFTISVERSRELGLTRQDYCGCLLSLDEARVRRAARRTEE
jgi:predicted adenine nucleotide alpha hydrolase (AANH) superfamily ATPase